MGRYKKVMQFGINKQEDWSTIYEGKPVRVHTHNKSYLGCFLG